MRKETGARRLSEAIGEIGEEIVEPAAERRANGAQGGKRRGRGKIRIAAAFTAACLVIAGGVIAANRGSGISVPVSAETLAAAVYPEAAPYPDESRYTGSFKEFDDEAFDRDYAFWADDERARFAAARELSGMIDFYRATVGTFLAGSDGENRVYSPISLYMALSVLAETTDGESRSQILGLLGASDAGTLRDRAKSLWAANYRNDGATTTVLANSVWLNGQVDFIPETAERLARDYYASVYRGDPSSEEMNRLLRDWLNEQTGGLLADAVQNTALSPETVMALYSTVYFRAKWDLSFQSVNNDERIFHGASGDRTVEFMNATNDENAAYYWGEDYGAIRLFFADGGEMWLILPDEGKTVGDVLGSGEYLEMIDSRYSNRIWENAKRMTVHYSVPKFDVASELSLGEGLEALGVTDVFGGTADFSPLAEDPEGMFLSGVRHAARVVIDEEGCTAAAFTEMAVSGSAAPPAEEMEFILDRPFLFVITGDTGGILFAGTVNDL